MVVTTWRQAVRLFAASLLSLLAFIALNVWVNRTFPARCADCHAHIGFPFAYYDEGGFAGDDALLWLGLVADLIVILGIAFGAVLGWERYRAKRHSRSFRRSG
jgi:hypothetical protein